jgi:thioredoxin reductase
MTTDRFDVIIIGGSYAGLAAGMGLGRALRNVLIVDSGMPANRYTPESHNFLTQDGRTPAEIALIAKEQVNQYNTIKMIEGQVVSAERKGKEFHIRLRDGGHYRATNLVFATGIIDVFPDIPGFAESWGKSVLHCPYCHGYEVRNMPTGVLGNGDYAFEFGSLISNWTSGLTIYTNGPSLLTSDQATKLISHNIRIVEDRIAELKNNDGYVEKIIFANGRAENIKALYTRPEFKQHCELPMNLGCGITDEGYISIDSAQRTTVPGIYACGDNVTRLRTVANAISMGTTTAITVNKDLILQSFQ